MSDAWMFGVTMWEMLSGAQLPYADLTPAQVAIQVVTADLRPQQPDGCPDDVYALMQRCWQQDVYRTADVCRDWQRVESRSPAKLKKKEETAIPSSSSKQQHEK
jgi:hypothetical protein